MECSCGFVIVNILWDSIKHYYGSRKATVVERFNCMAHTRITIFEYKKNMEGYIDALPVLLNSYNKTYHCSIKMRLIDVTEDNDYIMYGCLYAKLKLTHILKFQFNVENKVFIRDKRHPFRCKFFQR